MNGPKDTYKYQLKLGSKTILRGITYDLVRKESEYQEQYQGSRIVQVGRCTTRKAAQAWLGKGGKRKYTIKDAPSGGVDVVSKLSKRFGRLTRGQKYTALLDCFLILGGLTMGLLNVFYWYVPIRAIIWFLLLIVPVLSLIFFWRVGGRDFTGTGMERVHLSDKQRGKITEDWKKPDEN